MGVIRNLNVLNHSNVDEEWIYISSDEEGITNNDQELLQFVSGRRQQQRNQRSKRSSTKPEPTFAALGVKGKSHKKFRRYANANLFNEFGSLVNESELDDVSINDFMPQSPSSFSLLMNEIDSNINYNEFINCTEDEQNIMLKEAIELEISKMDHHKNNKYQHNGPRVSEDYRNCFLRIAPAIRKQLLKKHVPLGILASIEQKLIEHFRNDPQSIYKTMLACSYQRFLLHVCCQYLNLYCRSSNNKGKRLSCVHNERMEFIEPSKLLSEYLGLNY